MEIAELLALVGRAVRTFTVYAGSRPKEIQFDWRPLELLGMERGGTCGAILS